MKTKLARIGELKEDDIFIMNDVEYIVLNIHNGLVWYIESSNPNGRAKFMAWFGNFKIIERYER